MKHWKILFAASTIAIAINASFAGTVKPGIPKGWTGSGAIAEHYETGIDPAEGTAEHPAFFIASKENATNEDIAAVSQTFDATPYRGKMMLFSATTRYIGSHQDYSIWMRTVDDKDSQSTSSGSTNASNWTEFSRRMIISKTATRLELGIAMRGKGKVLMRNFDLQETTSTEMLKDKQLPAFVPMSPMLPAIVNLNFTE